MMLMLVHCGQVDLRTPTTPPDATAPPAPPLRFFTEVGLAEAAVVAAGGGCSSSFGCTRLVRPLGGRNGICGGCGLCELSATEGILEAFGLPSCVVAAAADTLRSSAAFGRSVAILGHRQK